MKIAAGIQSSREAANRGKFLLAQWVLHFRGRYRNRKRGAISRKPHLFS